MERLTEWTGEEWIPIQERMHGKIVGNRTCLARLAEYENTGLTPEEIMDGRMLTGWIPVSEQMPKENPAYLLVTRKGSRQAEKAWHWNGTWYCDNSPEVMRNVIAWMPLPELYEEGTE